METVISKIRYAVYEPRAKAGVTLIEMLIVVAVVALLATIVIGTATRIQDQGNEQVTANTFELLDGALQEYYDFWKSFPDPNDPTYLTHSAALYGQLRLVPDSRKTLEKISHSFIKGNPNNVDMLEIYDPWGKVLDYTYVDGDSFPKLRSAGPDKEFRTADDITSR